MRCWPLLLAAVLLWGLGVPLLAEEDPLAARLKALPTAVGDNRTITWGAKESLVDLGVREHVGYEHVRRANSGTLTPGRELLIPGRRLPAGQVENGLVVNLPELMLYRWQDGKPVAWYPVSIGMVGRRWHTPIGTLRIQALVRNPAWHRPAWAGGGVVPPGPRNPLGDRWIGLDTAGHGIHGTNDPSSIGRMVSHGCIRMYPAHVRELFDKLAVGMPVALTYETIAVGQQQGVVYLAIFPDVYSRGTNTLARAQARLAQYGLAGALSGDRLAARLQQADGVARPLLGSNIQVTRNGVPQALALAPTLRDGVAYLPMRTLAALTGAQVGWEEATSTATLTRGEKTVAFREGDAAFLALGAMFVPVRAAVEGLGGTVTFDGTTLDIAL